MRWSGVGWNGRSGVAWVIGWDAGWDWVGWELGRDVAGYNDYMTEP